MPLTPPSPFSSPHFSSGFIHPKSLDPAPTPFDGTGDIEMCFYRTVTAGCRDCYVKNKTVELSLLRCKWAARKHSQTPGFICMGPHPMVPGDVTSYNKSCRYCLPNDPTRRPEHHQMAQRGPMSTNDHREVQGMVAIPENGDCKAGGGRDDGDSRRGRKERDNTAGKENLGATTPSAQASKAEYRVFISEENAVEEGWVMVDMSKLILK